jgi:peptidoglycan-associated lipoprotein
MRKFVTVILSVFMIAALIGCAHKQAAAPPEQPVAKAPDSSSQQPGTSASASSEDIAAAVKEIQSKIGDVYFAYDKYDLDNKAKATLKSLAGLLGKRNISVAIEGSCDERGTKEYNLALGDKRATAAKQYLISLGIPSARISTISYGKEKPVCTESTEACWAKNRRDHIAVPEAGQ